MKLSATERAEIREEVLLRDESACSVCQDEGTDILRLVPKKLISKFLKNPDNYVTICDQCHKILHSGVNFYKALDKHHSGEPLNLAVFKRQYELLLGQCNSKGQTDIVKAKLRDISGEKKTNSRTQKKRKNIFKTLKARDGGGCFWCQKKLQENSIHTTLDHVITRSRGAGMAMDNLVLCCSRCNNKRGCLPSYEWVKEFPNREDSLNCILKNLFASQNELVALHARIEFVALASKGN